MKLSELKFHVDRVVSFQLPYEDPEVVIQTKLPYSSVGGTPFTKIKSSYNGFDWNQGKFFLVPEEPLSKPEEKFHDSYKSLQDKYGWLVYEKMQLEDEVKRLKKELKSFV